MGTFRELSELDEFIRATCDFCYHYKGGNCPILRLHGLWISDQYEVDAIGKLKRMALAGLIEGRECQMFIPKGERMETKMVEIRDSGIFIPAMATRLIPENDVERWLLAKANYGKRKEQQARYIGLTNLVTKQFCDDPNAWNDRTMKVAHQWLVEHFNSFRSGEVIDAQYLRNETKEPVESERIPF